MALDVFMRRAAGYPYDSWRGKAAPAGAMCAFFWLLCQRVADSGCGRAAVSPADLLGGGESRAATCPFTNELYGAFFQQADLFSGVERRF